MPQHWNKTLIYGRLAAWSAEMVVCCIGCVSGVFFSTGGGLFGDVSEGAGGVISSPLISRM